ncbi:glycosyltransferase [Exiguobacterium sp. SL14]|nr:glycosyltransferase [Exiguobacterium sp. SL14]MCY1689903.1 glycosyltransferase [Exiguobacterium sp. SL14]
MWTLHDCWSFTGHCAHFDYIQCEKWMTQCNKCPLKTSYPTSIMIDNSKNNFLIKKKTFTNLENLTLVMPSKWLKQKVEKSFFRDKRKYVINNGVDLNKFKPLNFEKNKEKFVILCVANVWTKEKGIDFIEKLSLNLRKDEVIKIIGLNKTQIKRFKNNEKIEGYGSLKDQKELAEIYSKADVFFNPTYNDTFPTTNIEAIASGIPVITFDTGGSGEIIDKECGFVVEKDDIHSVKKAISEIKSGKKDFNKNARDRAERNFCKDEKIMQYVDLYNKLFFRSR